MLKIKKIVATEVHGYIPINITFKTDITFLTGSNGCGKTTVLKLISSILEPNFDLLNQIEFKNLILVCWINEYIAQIKLTKVIHENTKKIEWEITKKPRSKGSDEKLPKDFGSFNLFPSNLNLAYTREEYRNLKESITREFITSNFYTKIDSFGNPILLGIDRKIVGSIYKKPLRRTRYDDRFEPESASFHDAQMVIRGFVSENAEKKRTLVDQLKANIFRTLFKYVHHQDVVSGYTRISEKSLISKKDMTISAIKRLDIGEEIFDEVEEYFNNISNLQKSLERKNRFGKEKRQRILNEWWANRPHLKRIELISEYAERYQKEIDRIDHPLNEIIRIINSFFDESFKQIMIGANGNIYVDWKNKDITTRNLSSGEIQLIVIIIHLVFCEYQKEQTVFVIDEPELSLHLSWQEKFVDAMTKASPGTQFILATHSPAIISKLEYEKKCVIMKNV